jgi:hypothetical protein
MSLEQNFLRQQEHQPLLLHLHHRRAGHGALSGLNAIKRLFFLVTNAPGK